MRLQLSALAFYAGAAFLEIAGCYAIWAWMKLGKSTLWLLPGIAALFAFGWLLTRVETDFAGRAYAAYGGIYILGSLIWMWGFEGQSPSRWDLAGALLALTGAVVVLIGAARG